MALTSKRRYHAPAREAAAAQTRVAVVRAAKDVFEARGWTATTMRLIAGAAGVSTKTVEAIFKTKGALLSAAVTYTFRGADDERPLMQREAAQAFEAAPDAPRALRLHAAYARPITQRSAAIAQVVESAAAGDPGVAETWNTMLDNRRGGARWATEVVSTKPGLRRGVHPDEIHTTILLAIDWATYRTLVRERGLTPEGYEDWMGTLYARMLVGDRVSRPGRGSSGPGRGPR